MGEGKSPISPHDYFSLQHLSTEDLSTILYLALSCIYLQPQLRDPETNTNTEAALPLPHLPALIRSVLSLNTEFVATMRELPSVVDSLCAIDQVRDPRSPRRVPLIPPRTSPLRPTPTPSCRLSETFSETLTIAPDTNPNPNPNSTVRAAGAAPAPIPVPILAPTPTHVTACVQLASRSLPPTPYPAAHLALSVPILASFPGGGGGGISDRVGGGGVGGVVRGGGSGRFGNKRSFSQAVHHVEDIMGYAQQFHFHAQQVVAI